MMQKFKEINFQGWDKIYENSEINCPQKFPTIQ